MLTFLISVPSDPEPLEDWCREHLSECIQDRSCKVVIGGYSGFLDFEDHRKNEAMMFNLAWRQIIKTES